MDNTVIESAGFSPARLTRIDTLMQGYVDDGRIAGLIATVARRGQTVYLEKFGMMDIEADKPMEFDAIFRIASMTKPITSAAIMTLYTVSPSMCSATSSKSSPANRWTSSSKSASSSHWG